MAKKFGALIRNARIRKGLNQKELAAMLDVTNSSVSNWEKDLNKPDVDTIEKICFILGLKPSDFFSDTINRKNPWHTPLTDAYTAANKKTRQTACDVLNIGYVDPGEDAPEVYVLPKYNGGAAAGVHSMI